MKPGARPPRLRESEEFGAALRALDGEAIPPARLASVEQRIAALCAPAAGAAGAAAGAAGAGAAAGAAGASLALKLGVPVVLALAAVGTYVATRPSSPSVPAHVAVAPGASPSLPPERAPAPVAPRAPDAGAAPLAPDVGAPAVEPAPAPAPGLRAPRAVATRRAAVTAAIDASAPRSVEPAPAEPPPPPTPAPAPAPSSELPEQLRLYAAAKEAARRGELARALAALADLLARFPRTPLRAEVRLSQAELLYRAGRLPEATLAVRALLVDPAHRGRRGELRRVLGDLLRKQGDCAGALAAYREALAGPLTEAEARAARAGLAACSR